jgi:hypothetical protein
LLLKFAPNRILLPESEYAPGMVLPVVSDILREKKLAFYGLIAFFLDSEGGKDESSSKKRERSVRIATHAFLLARRERTQQKTARKAKSTGKQDKNPLKTKRTPPSLKF